MLLLLETEQYGDTVGSSKDKCLAGGLGISGLSCLWGLVSDLQAALGTGALKSSPTDFYSLCRPIKITIIIALCLELSTEFTLQYSIVYRSPHWVLKAGIGSQFASKIRSLTHKAQIMPVINTPVML